MKARNTKFQVNLSTWSSADMCRQTDRHDKVNRRLSRPIWLCLKY